MPGRYVPLTAVPPVPGGRPRAVIPTKLVEILEDTYRRGEMYELPLDADDDADELLRLARLHAKHRNLTIEAVEHEGADGAFLWFRMKKKRPYRYRRGQAQ